MNELIQQETIPLVPVQANELAALDPNDNPFRLVVDPEMRVALRNALNELIDCHDEELSKYVAQGKLSIESYKEYIELFARSLKECMESREGVAYLLKACGFEVPFDQINLKPEWRWEH